MYIYKIVNLLNGKFYVGQRSKESKNDYYFGSGKILKNAISKYGKENFEKIIIEDNISNKESLNEKEIYWIKELKSRDIYGNYNLTDGGDGTIGYKHTLEDNAKNIKTRMITIYQYDLNLKLINKWNSISEAARFYNIKDSNIIKCLKGNSLTCNKFYWSYNILSDDERMRIFSEIQKKSPANKGKTMSPEFCKKISESQLGEKNHNFGKPRSAETIEKIRLSNIETKKRNWLVKEQKILEYFILIYTILRMTKKKLL